MSSWVGSTLRLTRASSPRPSSVAGVEDPHGDAAIDPDGLGELGRGAPRAGAVFCFAIATNMACTSSGVGRPDISTCKCVGCG